MAAAITQWRGGGRAVAGRWQRAARQQGGVIVDFSKDALAVSLGQKVVLIFNGYWGKKSEYSLATP